MIKETIKIKNKQGLHARASAKLVSMTNVFSSDIRVGVKEKELINAKSIMSVMMLAVGKGTNLNICIDGHDEVQAYEAISALVNNNFGEDEE